MTGSTLASLAQSAVLPAPVPDASWLLGEAGRLLDDARRTRVPGSGFGWLDASGGVDASRGSALWITNRMVHCFSLGVLLGRDGDAEYADHGLRALETVFADREYGGWFAQLDADGPRLGPKGAYEHAFVVLAGASATLAGRPGARALLDEALAVQEEHFWDDEAGAVVEEWDRAWTTCDAYRGANANMHTVEAYLAASDATGRREWRERALRIATRVIDQGAREHDWRVPEHFDEQWEEQPEYNADDVAHPFRPYGATPGHGLEWARLLLHLEASLVADRVHAPTWLRFAAIGLFDRALADGWDAEHGGICYTTDWNGAPVVEQHFHWPVCEGLMTAAALHRVTGEQRFADWYARLWDYARRSYVDPAVPGWQHEVDPDGTPSARTWTGRPDIYHALQATLLPFVPLSPVFAGALARRR